jgi:hypothetical protein
MNPKSMRQTFCMPQPMSLYCSISHQMDPTYNDWLMRCLSNAHGSQMELFFRLAILRCWKEHQFFLQNQAEIHETDFLHSPTNVLLPQHFPSIWTQQTMFDWWDAYSISMGARWSCFLGFWSWDVGKKIRIEAKPSWNQWDRLSACPYQCPSTTAFLIEWTQHTMFDEWDAYPMPMGVRSCWFLKVVGCYKTWTALSQLPAKIHETDLLHAPTNVLLQQHFPSVWTQQKMLNGWDAYPMPMGVRWRCFLGFWSWDVGKNIRIEVKPSRNPWDRLSACPNQCPSTTAFFIHIPHN